MVSILLTVLKIIGITVLIVLGLILFILLLVLFVPVRYRGKGSYQNGMLAAKLHASWLLHVVSIQGAYQNQQSFRIYLKIFGITLYDNQRESKKKRKNKKVKSTKTKAKSTGEIQAASSAENFSENSLSEDDFSEEVFQRDTVDEENTVCTRPDITIDNAYCDELTESSSKELSLFQKIKIFFTNFVNFFKNIKFTFDKVCDTMVRIKDNIKYYLKVLQLDSTKRAFATCQKQLKRVLRKLFPRKYQINLHLGFDDPAVMGEILAVWGMFYPLHQGNINIQPEFEQSVIEGELSFRGRTSVFVFVQAACILFFDKDIKRLIKQLKRSAA